MISSLFLLFTLFVTVLVGQTTQPPITFVNNHEDSHPILICSIDINGAPGDDYSIAPPSGNTLYNVTVTPTTTVGKYHIVPASLYTCQAVYMPVLTYAVEALSPIIGGHKEINLIIHLYSNQTYPLGLKGISLWQNGTLLCMCQSSDCGPNGDVFSSPLNAPMQIVIN
eukprot:TRINITY_DN2377_c0_g1_i1.p1 TRINITY_DN2377_c0_g1~~TRINITY_DN2377_c0_g1_i1.p1  ORF type:complete len:185 (-),score=26.51 TRINITY_DN2377_c0_g1_i1:79-582(-)